MLGFLLFLFVALVSIGIVSGFVWTFDNRLVILDFIEEFYLDIKNKFN